MSSKYLLDDLKSILNGVQKVIRTDAILRRAEIETKLHNSSLQQVIHEVPKLPSKVLPQTPKEIQDLIQRSSMIGYGLREVTTSLLDLHYKPKPTAEEGHKERDIRSSYGTTSTSIIDNDEEIVVVDDQDIEAAYFKSLGIELFQESKDQSHINRDGSPKSFDEITSNQKRENIFKNLDVKVKQDTLNHFDEIYDPKGHRNVTSKAGLIKDLYDGKPIDDRILMEHFSPDVIEKLKKLKSTSTSTDETIVESKKDRYAPFESKTNDGNDYNELEIKNDQHLYQILNQNSFEGFKTPQSVSSKASLIKDLVDGKEVDENVLKRNLTPEQARELKKTSQKNKLKPLSQHKPESQLGPTSKERKVPATRIARLVSYGGLAAGLGIGALSEMTKRSLGIAHRSENVEKGSFIENPFFSESNIERIVDTLCRVRGAALKLGQMLSIQDDSMINPQLQKAFERVRHSADFMPSWQMEKILEKEFGFNWRTKFMEFDPKPFAAASIGQVHLGKLHDRRPVAVKIQYPGVAQGIESDIDNLVSILNVWDILPRGIFIDNIIVVAKRELSWETKYLRESECAKRFRKILEPYPEYYIPEVIDELTTDNIYTTELIEGLPVDQCSSLDQESRDRISYLLLDLFFRELFEFRFMQTDPNWSNFLYNVETKQIGLIDFGASREYDKEFVDNYMMIIKGGAEENRQIVLEYSRRIGFLTGYESKLMENAHVDTVMLLAKSLRSSAEPYDFGSQEITREIQRLAVIMVAERLCPPPEEIYSLHRKLSGMFLLCTKLGGRVKCRSIFDNIVKNYEFGPSFKNQEVPLKNYERQPIESVVSSSQ